MSGMLKVSNPDEAGNSLFVWGIPQSSLDVVVVVVVVITIAYVYESDVYCRAKDGVGVRKTSR